MAINQLDANTRAKLPRARASAESSRNVAYDIPSRTDLRLRKVSPCASVNGFSHPHGGEKVIPAGASIDLIRGGRDIKTSVFVTLP